MTDIKTAKNKYKEFFNRIKKRPGVEKLGAYLEKNGFFSAPASTRFHLCVEGGLLIHSVSVTQTALGLKKNLLPSFTDESVILCSLYHDAHKATDGFGNETYIKNTSDTSLKRPYLWNRKQMNFSGGHKSLLIISKFVSLTKDEMQAIAYHDGPYVPSWDDIKYDPYPLTLLIHSADVWSAWVLEKNKEKKPSEKLFLDGDTNS